MEKLRNLHGRVSEHLKAGRYEEHWTPAQHEHQEAADIRAMNNHIDDLEQLLSHLGSIIGQRSHDATARQR
jgi:hypothetical protein